MTAWKGGLHAGFPLHNYPPFIHSRTTNGIILLIRPEGCGRLAC